MLDRLRSALVESFVGAIALGYLLAQVILNFVNIFGSPLGRWVARSEYRDSLAHTTTAPVSLLAFAVPELVRFVGLLIVWNILLRWLYFKPLKGQNAGPPPSR